jgi:hypothetical protein
MLRYLDRAKLDIQTVGLLWMSDQLVAGTAELSLGALILKIAMLLFCKVRTEPLYTNSNSLLIPLAARSKAWVCNPSFAGIAGSSPSGDMDVCLLRVTCVFR